MDGQNTTPPADGNDVGSPRPRSLSAGLRLLWSQFLFPGVPCCPSTLRLPALLVLLVLPAVLLYPCMSFYLFEPDEGRYAEIPREMHERGEWVVPYLQGQPYLDKPPLLYWLVMLSYSLLGVHDWAARLVPALTVHATILTTYLLGRRSLGERPAFWAALLLCLSPGVVGVGRLLVLDGLLAFWVTLALLSAFEAVRTPRLRRGWWLLSAAASGLGVLTKGPVILILLIPPLWLYRRLSAQGARIGWRSCLVYLGVTLAIALPWYVAVCLRLPEFIRHFLWEHNVVRFLTPFDHLEPFWFYIPLLLLGLLPGTLLLPGLLHFLGTGDTRTAGRRCPELGFFLLAGLWCVLFFSMSGCKLPTYILPAFPPLALALGYYLVHSRWARSRWTYAAIATALLVQAAGHFVIIPWYADYRSPLPQWDAVVRHCSDPNVPVVCFPRSAHSVAFYLGREDMPNYRSKDLHLLRHALREQPRTVVLFTHRHSLEAFRQTLPPGTAVVESRHFGLEPLGWLSEGMRKPLIQAMGKTALGLCDLAVIERRPLTPGPSPPKRGRGEQ